MKEKSMPKFTNPIKSSIFSLTLLLGVGLGACNKPLETNAPKQLASALVQGQNWSVNSTASFVSFISVKNTNIVESHNFPSLGGGVDENGKAKISIDLTQVKTGIEIRNQRLNKHVFKTDRTPQAIITANLDRAMFSGLQIGDHVEQIQPLKISLAGHEAGYDAYIMVTRIGANKVQVNSVRPILLDADDFDLSGGIEILRGLAKLDTITPIIPVTFSVQLTAN